VKQFTFEWQYLKAHGWTRSIKRFDTIDEAATAMASFAAICFENDFIIDVHLVAVKA
jgi:hypothetical protein